jgi:hypothetical protein
MLKPGKGVLTMVVYLIVTASAFAASRTLTGIVTDTMCGKKHMMAGKSDADCTRECMKSKGSWTYGLAVGEKVYSLSGDSKQLASFAGKRAKVTGEQTGNNVAVQSITSAP